MLFRERLGIRIPLDVYADVCCKAVLKAIKKKKKDAFTKILFKIVTASFFIVTESVFRGIFVLLNILKEFLNFNISQGPFVISKNENLYFGQRWKSFSKILLIQKIIIIAFNPRFICLHFSFFYLKSLKKASI